MLQYLLNATAIWLISLVMFDVFLKRESYHGYNRFYLLFTFLLGTFLPLCHWQRAEHTLLQGGLQRPLQQIIIAKTDIANVTIPATNNFGWVELLVIAYTCGAVVTLCLLMIDVMKLMKYYSGEKRYKEGKWQIIETGKEHAPFSFLNTLFVSNKRQYSEQEWCMILVHEKRHSSLWHFADLLLMQAARIVYWFHPLVYLYNKRLLLVHEYQADETSAQQPNVYGKFLVEQAIMQSAPILSHSFNGSPVKKRIVMLTHRSSEIAKSKLLVFIPLVAVCILCFSQNSFSNKPKKEGNKCIYRGNTIEFLAPQKPDNYLYTDEATGKTSRKPITWPMEPIKLNGGKIYNHYKDKNIQSAAYVSEYKSLEECVMTWAKNEIETLSDGHYGITIADIVIDSKGNVAYFDNQGIFQIGADIDKQLKQKQAIDDKINERMNCLGYLSAYVNNARVAYLVNDGNGWSFTIKDHKIIPDNAMK